MDHVAAHIAMIKCFGEESGSEKPGLFLHDIIVASFLREGF